jgi:hypothetical protein
MSTRLIVVVVTVVAGSAVAYFCGHALWSTILAMHGIH